MAFQSKNSAVGDDYGVWKYMKNLCLMSKILKKNVCSFKMCSVLSWEFLSYIKVLQ